MGGRKNAQSLRARSPFGDPSGLDRRCIRTLCNRYPSTRPTTGADSCHVFRLGDTDGLPCPAHCGLDTSRTLKKSLISSFETGELRCYWSTDLYGSGKSHPSIRPFLRPSGAAGELRTKLPRRRCETQGRKHAGGGTGGQTGSSPVSCTPRIFESFGAAPQS